MEFIAGCNNATASSGAFDVTTSAAATFTCFGSTTTQGAADYLVSYIGMASLWHSCLLPCDLFPDLRDELWRQRKGSHSIVGLRVLYPAVPNRLIHRQMLVGNITQPEPCKFPCSQTSFCLQASKRLFAHPAKQ